jgi:hypothetical protein
MARRKPRDWFACPACGAEVPAGALACPACGSDDRTGWSPETEYDGLDLPDPDEKPAEDAVWRDPAQPAPSRAPTWVIVAGVVLLVALAVLVLKGVF